MQQDRVWEGKGKRERLGLGWLEKLGMRKKI